MQSQHSPAQVDELRHKIELAAPLGSSVEVTRFGSGALDVLVRRPDGRVVVMQGAADGGQYGITSELAADAGFNDGHPLVVTSYDAMVEVLLAAVR